MAVNVVTKDEVKLYMLNAVREAIDLDELVPYHKYELSELVDMVYPGLWYNLRNVAGASQLGKAFFAAVCRGQLSPLRFWGYASNHHKLYMIDDD